MKPREPMTRIATAIPVNGPYPPYRGGAALRTGFPRPPSARSNDAAMAGRIADRMIVLVMLLAVTATFTLSSAMLTNWKIHYLTAGGAFYEKFHPATGLTFLAFGLLLLRQGDPIGEIDRMLSRSKLILLYLALCI